MPKKNLGAMIRDANQDPEIEVEVLKTYGNKDQIVLFAMRAGNMIILVLAWKVGHDILIEYLTALKAAKRLFITPSTILRVKGRRLALRLLVPHAEEDGGMFGQATEVEYTIPTSRFEKLPIGLITSD